MSMLPTLFQEFQRVPKGSIDHLWADYIELLCVANIDGEFSKADVLDWLKEGKDLGVIEGRLASKLQLRDAEADDWIDTQIGDWYRHLQFRAGAFTDFYPFHLTRANDTLILHQPLTPRQKQYLFLLLSSNLRYFTPKDRATLTNTFEIISLGALRKLLPPNAEAHLFGSRQQGRYTGTLWEKINALAGDLQEQVRADESDFPLENRGDKGLDLVAWIPLGDDVGSLPIVFGQCACSLQDWSTKQSSSSAAAWSRTISPLAPPSNMAFIPHCFRRTGGEWYKSTDIHESVLIDRLRLLRLLGDSYDLIENSPSNIMVEEAIAHHQPAL